MNTVWKPIETAPKDGTFILAKCKGTLHNTNKTFVPAVVAWKNGEWYCEDTFPLEGCIWPLSLWTELPVSDDGNEYPNAYDL